MVNASRPQWPPSQVEVRSGFVNADPDAKLLEAWRAGDQKAAGALLSKYYPLIRRNVATKVPEYVVDDLVQKVVLALHRGRDQIRAGGKLGAYALSITKNVICEHYRRQQRRPDDAGVIHSSVRELGAGPSSILLALETDRILLEALRSVPLDDQFLLELYYWERMAGPELAQVFSVPESNIRSHLRRAKQRLREQLDELSTDKRALAETVTDLDAWAERLREELQAHLNRAKP